MSVTRRQAMLGAATAATAGPALLTGANARASSKPVEAGHDMSSMPPDWVRQDQVALLIYPAMTALDMVAPQYAFASLMGATVHLVAKTRDPIVSDTGLTILPTSTFDECPRDLDVICVPGGSTGTLAAMQDDATLGFLADRGSRAKFGRRSAPAHSCWVLPGCYGVITPHRIGRRATFSWSSGPYQPTSAW
ncbi:DJ-1/PfpI family protein [Shinella fusca]|uniref:Transcriptional regulator GlxA family with amidase domain n=1 Tax=Shinella fusca TaxID=544480 RepID=A0A7W7YSJ7_9HYPH|nr:transcriptional regulator GlxA family with amidase domain [Shinella fusca]